MYHSSTICLVEGKTRLESCNYSCTVPIGMTPRRKQHTFWNIIQCTILACLLVEGKTRQGKCNYSCTAPVGPTPRGKQHTFWSIVWCTILARVLAEGKAKLKESNPSYLLQQVGRASTHCGVTSDVSFWHDVACPPAEGNTRMTQYNVSCHYVIDVRSVLKAAPIPELHWYARQTSLRQTHSCTSCGCQLLRGPQLFDRSDTTHFNCSPVILKRPC